MQEISLNILDIAQNSIRAQATLIEITIEENTAIDEKMESFVSYVENLTLLEASKLIKVLEDRLGVSAAAPVAVAAAAPDDNQQNDNPAAVTAAKKAVVTHIDEPPMKIETVSVSIHSMPWGGKCVRRCAQW